MRRRRNEAIRSFRGSDGNRGNGASAVCSGAVPRRVFPPFLRAEKRVAPKRETLPSCPRLRRSGCIPQLMFQRFMKEYSFGTVPLSLREKADKERPGGPISRRSPWESFPIGQGAATPLDSPVVTGGAEDDDRTRDRCGGNGEVLQYG